MPENSVYQKWGVPRVINCVGYATRVGGSAPTPEVVQAMTMAHEDFIEIDDLQAAASQIIARATGAQAGIVTCGAGAALTLAGAACLAGNDPSLMDALPDTSSFERNRIVYPVPHLYDYDHPVRACGAHIDFVEYDGADALAQIEAAITPRTAAIGYVWKRVRQRPSVEQVAELAHSHNLPLIVDAALSLPPVSNLKNPIAAGADLVALSGGKHLGGPQASGLLFGRSDLVRSAWLQMVDMHIHAVTWSLSPWIKEGFIAQPPRHGIGRSMKVSKEAIVGVLTALERYEERDHNAELEIWKARVAWLEEALRHVPNLQVTSLFPAPNGQPYPTLRLRSEKLGQMLRFLSAQNPKILLAAHDDKADVAYIFPMQLRDDELPVIARQFERAARGDHA